MDQQKAIVVPLHINWKYLNVCCDLINEEWPRSTSARMYSLTASCDNLPTSLILVLIGLKGNTELVIGHSKISPIHRIPAACFIESVVIAKKFRSKGWGRYIMQETEKYIITKKKSVIYLSTSDKEEFYQKLGYTKCEPVSIYGDKSLQLKNNFVTASLLPKSVSTLKNKDNTNPPTTPTPPPSPKCNLYNSSTKTYMRKLLV